MSSGGDADNDGDWLTRCSETVNRLREGNDPPSGQRPYIEIEIEPDD
jgi:hypothetical protein